MCTKLVVVQFRAHRAWLPSATTNGCISCALLHPMISTVHQSLRAAGVSDTKDTLVAHAYTKQWQSLIGEALESAQNELARIAAVANAQVSTTWFT